MVKHLVAATCVILPGLVAVHRGDAQGPGHTPTACWKVSREYHEPYDDQFAKGVLDLAKRVRIQSVPLADPPTKALSPNGACWFAQERPDTSRPGPGTTRLLVFNERRTLVQLSFIDLPGSSGSTG